MLVMTVGCDVSPPWVPSYPDGPLAIMRIFRQHLRHVALTPSMPIWPWPLALPRPWKYPYEYEYVVWGRASAPIGS